jgi:hypothetical protein
MLEWMLSDELERIWKEAVLAKSRYYSGILLEGLWRVRTEGAPTEIRTVQFDIRYLVSYNRRLRQLIPPKRWYLSTNLHGVTYWYTIVLGRFEILKWKKNANYEIFLSPKFVSLSYKTSPPTFCDSQLHSNDNPLIFLGLCSGFEIPPLPPSTTLKRISSFHVLRSDSVF